jgi:hypothetical protein
MQAYAARQRIKEGKHAINWTRLSCKGKAQNEVRLQLHALAYNLGVFLQKADLPEEVADWSLTSLQTQLIKPGRRLSVTPGPSRSNSLRWQSRGNLLTRILAAIYKLRSQPVTA